MMTPEHLYLLFMSFLCCGGLPLTLMVVMVLRKEKV